MFAQSGQLAPRYAAVARLEERGVFHTRVHVIGIVERRLEVPDPFKLPWVLCAVIPLVGAGDSVVDELVALAARHPVRRGPRSAAGRFPCLTAIAGAL